MRSVDELIFDCLASGQGVVLPDAGTLTVTRKPAALAGRKRLSAPEYRVAFSPDAVAGYYSVPALIMREYGAEGPEADRIYREWLDGASGDGEIAIGNAGLLKDGRFIVDAGLNSLLNPSQGKGYKLKPRRSAAPLWISLSVAVLAVAGWFVYNDMDIFGGSGSAGINVAPRPAPVVPAPPAAPVETAPATSPDTVGASPVVEMPAPQPPIAPSPVGQEGYYVVFGVFSDPANADSYIDKLSKRASELPLLKMPYGGKTMVAVRSGATAEAANADRRRLSAFESGVWIYHKK